MGAFSRISWVRVQKATFFAVVRLVQLRDHGKALLDAMGRGQTAALESYAGEVGVDLDDVLQRRGDHTGLHGHLGLCAIGLKVLPGQRRHFGGGAGGLCGHMVVAAGGTAGQASK